MLEPASKTAARVRTGQRPILLVDDDEAVCSSLMDFLMDEGHEVVVAANGLRALEILRAGVQPRIILLDVMMPIMDGWDFREQQLRDPVLAAIPVAVVTASGFNAETLRKQFSAVACLSKPVDIDRLLATIRDIPTS